MTRAPLLLAALLFVEVPVCSADDEASMQSVVVRPGDTLWSIAHAYLKDPSRWDEILKHNRLPTSDPTVALPGMTLRVPIKLIKSGLRAAFLVYRINRVLARRKDSADWKASPTNSELYQGDSLRTLEDSRARVKFLNKDLLSLEPNSMAVIKPNDPDADVELRAGSVFAGHARVVTSSARVTPRSADTRYAASVEADLTTRVEVYKGSAGVEAQGSVVEVPAGMQTRVQPGLAPEIPRMLDNAPALEARAEEFASATLAGGGAALHPRAATEAPAPDADAATLRGDIESLSVGVAILGFHVQAARDRDFKSVLFDRKYDNDETFRPADAGLPPGAYWWRVAVVDLLGAEGRYSEGRYYTVGIKRDAAPEAAESLGRMLTVTEPVDGEHVDTDNVRVAGVLRDDRLEVKIAGRPARVDADGSFFTNVPIKDGLNEIELVVSDKKGNTVRIVRHVTRP